MNDEPQYERRLILAFVLSALVFLVFVFLPRRTPPAPTTSPAPAAPAAPPATSAPSEAPPSAAPLTATPHAGPAPGDVVANREEDVVLETPAYHVVFSNRGAVVRSWILKRYTDEFNHPLDLVDAHFSSTFGYPLSFWSSDENLRNTVNQALFQPSAHGPLHDPATLEFRWSRGGISVSKRFVLAEGYVVGIESNATQNGAPLVHGIAWPGAFGDRSVIGSRATEQLVQAVGDSVKTFAVKKVNPGEQWPVIPYNFVGVEDQYFAAVFLPKLPAAETVTTLKNNFKPLVIEGGKPVEQQKDIPTIGVAVSQGAVNQQRAFIGPKQLDLMTSVDPQLRKLVDFGWFSVIAEPLFLWMHWTYDHAIPNYGWVIVFITIVLTMLVFPFRLKGQKSQQKMAALQHRIKPLNEKMKRYPLRDPRRQEIQQQIMQVYQEEGVNPFGGCLPMLVQLPLIYAFYRVLAGAIELRHQPWIGWIHDLSAPDRYWVLPIMLVGAQFWMMAIMPPAPGQDATQAKLMKYVMPIFIGIFFFALPSGVNLYYLTSNLVYIGQQMFMNRFHPATPNGPKARAKRA